MDDRASRRWSGRARSRGRRTKPERVQARCQRPRANLADPVSSEVSLGLCGRGGCSRSRARHEEFTGRVPPVKRRTRRRPCMTERRKDVHGPAGVETPPRRHRTSSHDSPRIGDTPSAEHACDTLDRSAEEDEKCQLVLTRRLPVIPRLTLNDTCYRDGSVCEGLRRDNCNMSEKYCDTREFHCFTTDVAYCVNVRSDSGPVPEDNEDCCVSEARCHVALHAVVESIGVGHIREGCVLRKTR